MSQLRGLAGRSRTGMALALLLLTCCALSAQNVEHRPRNIILVHGAWLMDLGGKASNDILVKMAITSASSKNRRHPSRKMWLPRSVSLRTERSVHTCCSQLRGAVITEAGTDPAVAGLVYIAAHMPDAGEK